ncbi:quinol:electron acceptor oxidoreductase subunit ActD [Dankookia sp. P2]|uniref:quinol:electron acceptor oxidoreductase subunit ActD n=1 Tax=Dankookia sp. P2 TaxID=3423955 RepID=UPI003D6711FC
MSAATQDAGLPPTSSYAGMIGIVADSVLRHRPGRRYWIALGLAFLATLGFVGFVTWLFVEGIGIYGNNATVVWGFPIADYVWWIGIGNAGTLISALLLITRQPWRASINRFAEAMTLFAASIAGLFPILHLGRPYRAYWLAPYPNTMELWPQWRSALVWDFAAIAVYILFSLLFWYLGLIPDLATMRDRAPSRRARLIYGVLAFGWRGSARHWQRHDAVYRAMAALAVPLVVSVHSVVGLDFAASLMPGWQESIFPPYFVVGALFSGFAMVVTLAVILRWALGLQAVITERHFDAMGKILLAGAIVMGMSYATEWFLAWYGGEHAERGVLRFRIHRSLCAALLDDARLQRDGAAVAVVPPDAHQPACRLRHRGGHQYRHVAGADPDHLEHALARLFAGHAAAVPPDFLGLGDARHLLRRLRLPLPLLRPPGAGRGDARREQALARRTDGTHMSLLLAEFRDPETLLDAARRARDAGWQGLDAHVPFDIDGLTEALGLPPTRLRLVMLVGGVLAGALAYTLQWYSAVHDYPLNSGGRPLHSWPAFLIPTFEAVVLGAILSGVVGFLVSTGLPRLNHPAFAAHGFERASQDRFFLAVADSTVDAARLAAALDGLGPLSIREVG